MNRFFEFFRRKKQYSDLPVSLMTEAINEWSALYENSSALGSGRSLNLAAAVSQELARLVTIEFSSRICGSERAEYLDEQYQRVIEKSREFTEYACAKGGVVLKPYFENGKVMVSIIQADAFYPTAFTSDGEMTGAVFFESFVKDGYYYTRLEEHTMEAREVTIRNTAYRSKTRDVIGYEIPLTDVEKWAKLEPLCIIENLDRPLFAYVKMPFANNIEPGSPLGVSAFSRATMLIKDAYEQYSNLLWEFESSKRALYLDECAVRRDENGEATLPEKRLYRMLTTDDDTLFKDWSPEIRNNEILSGLDRILRSIEFNCGLAYGTLSDMQNVEKTAEEIKASKQRSYSTVCDIQNALKKALCDLVYAMNVFCDVYTTVSDGEYSVSFDFDDSVICDRTAQFDEKLRLLQSGIINPWEIRAWYFNEDEETAKKRIGEINEIQMCNSVAQGG